MLSFGFIQRDIASGGSVKQPFQMSPIFFKSRPSGSYVIYWVTYFHRSTIYISDSQTFSACGVLQKSKKFAAHLLQNKVALKN